MDESKPSAVSVIKVRKHWYVLAESHEVSKRPVKRLLFGDPIVLFRDATGAVGALQDRCPHRNVPLSMGRIKNGNLECGYHGWQFNTRGECQAVPGLCGEATSANRYAPSHAVREQEGYIWVYGEANSEPINEPYRLPNLDGPGYTTVRRTVDFPGSLHQTIENALDVPHTAYLHKGLFRGVGEPNEIQAVVTRTSDTVQAEFIGEPRPGGIAGKILSPSGGVVSHFDRFLLPSIAQIEYHIGDENHICTTSLCTPVDDFHTRIFAVITFRMRLPGWIIKPILNPIAMRIFRQDVVVLELQSQSIRHFGEERFTSTELDLLGAQILRLMRRAERGAVSESDPTYRKEIRLTI
jgi:phenylpropionate dioxygenase-like ring-hydroxylating dioxygenase large terminal subunit